MTKPLVSIITASYNSQQTIKDTLQSVLDQSYDPIEYIVVDGGSTDNTVSIIKTFEDKFADRNVSFKWLSEPDKGIYDAWNKGVDMATGKWLSFLGSDDIFLPTAIASYVHVLDTHENIDFVSSKVEVHDGHKVIKTISGEWSWKTFRRYMSVPHVGAFHASAYFKKYGLFDTSYRIAGDYELLLRAKDQLNAHHLNEVTVRMGVGGVSNQQIRSTLLETKKAKVHTAGMSPALAHFDFMVALAKANLKKLIR